MKKGGYKIIILVTVSALVSDSVGGRKVAHCIGPFTV